jgi:hypothetical protein
MPALPQEAPKLVRVHRGSAGDPWGIVSVDIWACQNAARQYINHYGIVYT